MSNILKVTWYFVNYLILYCIIGVMACFISFPILGMIFGAPSVFIAAIALSFYRTINRCIYGDLTIDRSYYMRAIIEEAMIIGGIIILVIFVGIVSNIFR